MKNISKTDYAFKPKTYYRSLPEYTRNSVYDPWDAIYDGEVHYATKVERDNHVKFKGIRHSYYYSRPYFEEVVYEE